MEEEEGTNTDLSSAYCKLCFTFALVFPEPPCRTVYVVSDAWPSELVCTPLASVLRIAVAASEAGRCIDEVRTAVQADSLGLAGKD